MTLSLVLASASPQRRAILEQLGLRFDVVVSGVQEREAGPAEEIALENARRKAEAVAPAVPDALVLAVDTVVVLDDRVYGKPADEEAAGSTLTALSGRTHVVVSGVCVVRDGSARTAFSRTRVAFRALDESLRRWYLATGEWRERAGGYAIQGRGAALVRAIEGDYFNVVGLPVATLVELVPDLLQSGSITGPAGR